MVDSMVKVSLPTLFDMFSTAICQWPPQFVHFEDVPLKDGLRLRTICTNDGNEVVAKVIIGRSNQLLDVVYPKLVLH